jgi:hypothetical protein
MADPLTGLATVAAVSSIFQVIDFSAKVISETTRLVKSSSTALEENSNVEILVQQYSNLADRVLSSNNAQRPLNANEQAVDELAKDCKEKALKLLRLLETLKVDRSLSGVGKIVHSARKTIAALRKRKQIEQQQHDVARLHNALSTMLMHILKAGQFSELELVLDKIERTQSKNAVTLLESKEEIMHAINGISAQLGVSNSQRKSEMNVYIDTQITSGDIQKSELIIESLRLPEMRLRRDCIRQLPEDSVSYFFEEQHTPFSRWLRSAEDIFWLSGKAGSGKSTLMKALCEHSSTRENLTQWSGGDRLVVVDAYLWSSGTPLQRNELGLLQPLVYQILRRNPDLVEIATPGRWKSDVSYLRRPDTWSRRELSQTLENVLRNCQSNIHFCIFIDALDEYEGDYDQLTTRIKDLASHPRIKLCVSSRNWHVFEDAFGRGTNNVRLQELTLDAIYSFVKEKLMPFAEDDSMAHELAHQVLHKGAGCFLWVTLMVDDLLERLKSGDSIAIILRSVDTRPPELQQLFSMLMSRTAPVQRRRTLQALELATITLGTHSSSPVINSSSFLTFWLLSKGLLENPRFAFDQGFQDLTNPQLREMVKETRRFLDVYCTGLLQLTSIDATPSTWRPSIEFLHRTVYDFLCLKFEQDARDSGIPVHFKEEVFSSHLALARCKFIPRDAVQSCQHVTEIILSAIKGLDSNPVTLETLAEFEKVALYYWDKKCVARCPLHVLRIENGSLLLQLASYFISGGLHAYAVKVIQNRPSYVQESETGAWPMLRPALGLSLGFSFPIAQIDLNFVEKLLEHGANPNCQDGRIWHEFLIKAVREAPLWSDSDMDHASKVAAIMISHYADTDSSVTLPRGVDLGEDVSPNREVSPMDIWTTILRDQYMSNIQRV